MATLKANGPKLLRISREHDTPEDLHVSWRRKTVVYFASGAILVKNDVRFRPTASFDPPTGRFHSWGWKKATAVKDNPRPLEVAKNSYRIAQRDQLCVEFVALEVQS